MDDKYKIDEKRDEEVGMEFMVRADVGVMWKGDGKVKDTEMKIRWCYIIIDSLG